MARLTGDGIVDMVRDFCSGETTETLSDERILRYVNQAYLYYATKYQWPQLLETVTVTTSSGTAAYELSVADVNEINYIVNTTSNITLRRIDSKQYNEYTQGDTSSITGTPVYWAYDGVGSNGRMQIVLYPTPDATYSLTVSYYEEPAEIVADPASAATSSLLPDAWDTVIIHRAAARGWVQLGSKDKAMLHIGLAQGEEQELLQRISQKTTAPRQTQSRVGKALSGI